MDKRERTQKSTIRGTFSLTEHAVLSAAIRRLPATWHVRRAMCDHLRCYAYSPGGVVVLAYSPAALACRLKLPSENVFRWQLEMGTMDTCEYCGQQHHPMTIWTKGYELIHVCDTKMTLVETGDGIDISFSPSDCPARATADGYTRRPDLTPKR